MISCGKTNIKNLNFWKRVRNGQIQSLISLYFVQEEFSDFTISPWIVVRLNELGFGTTFEVQEKTVPLSLDVR